MGLLPPSDKASPGELRGRMGISEPPFLGMMKRRDRGTIPYNAFEHLENVRFLTSKVLTVRGGETDMSDVDLASPIDGLFDCGEDGGKPTSSTPIDLGAAGGGGTGVLPPTPSNVNFNAVGSVNEWSVQGAATSNANKVTAVGAVGGTYIKPGAGPGDALHTDQVFRFSDAGITALHEEVIISNLQLHVTIVLGTPGTIATAYPLAGLHGILTTGGLFGLERNAAWEDGVEFHFRLQRPGGGQWYGRDLRHATCEFGVYLDYQAGDGEPWVDRLYFSYTVGG